MNPITPEEQAAFDHFELRAYQIKAVLAVRQLFREGKRNVLVCAPTAAGKTRIAACILQLTHDHGKRANFVVDRENLVTQTSGTFDAFKIDHGVIKQKHWRYRPYERVQISSVQTLMRRGWPEADLIVVDECHTVYQTTTAKLKARESYALGLTATPFTKGLGQVYDALVNVETTNNLIEQGALVPFRIFSPSQPNMAGVRVNSKGEWSDDEATKRALEVVGDCVAEYLKHGNSQKFICSAVTIVHARELHRQFTAAGVVCSVYTSLEDEDECDAIVGEFRKPDSYIRGLITVSKATKGFDVPDVGCVIMARPLRKSLADHIQFLGRGLRTFAGKTECVARGTLVLTDIGEVPIEQITSQHRVWDGENFVNHGGAVRRGVKPVIEYDGLVATPDHEVWTNVGWTRLEDAASGKRRIARTGIAGRPIRLADDCVEIVRRGELSSQGVGLLPELQPDEHGAVLQYGQKAEWSELSDLPRSAPGERSGMAVPASPGDAFAVHEPPSGVIRELRSSGDRVSVCVGERSGALDCGEFGYPGGSHDANRPARERGTLRAREFALGHAASKCEQHSGDAQGQWATQVSYVSSALSGGSVCGQNADQTAENNDLRRGISEVLQPSIDQAEREVWDVLNAGPLQRFTANGRLVHNCIVLDHSGNCERFWDDMNAFFLTGALELDDGTKKPKASKPKERPEDTMTKCPVCKTLHKPVPFCPSCGHEYPVKNTVKHVPGTLEQLLAGDPRKLAADVWPQICHYTLKASKGDRDRAKSKAYAMFKELTGVMSRSDFHTTKPRAPRPDVQKKLENMDKSYWIKRRAIAGTHA